MSDTHYPPVPILRSGLTCRCPRCGAGKLFSGFLTLAPTCPHCGLDFSGVDAGDGPAVFVIFIVGFLVVGLALWTEVRFQPPLWLHIALWFPLTFAATFGLLRPFKAILIALQYKHKAMSETGQDGDRDWG